MALHVEAVTPRRFVCNGEGAKKWNIGTGFAEAGPDRVVILTESCEEG